MAAKKKTARQAEKERVLALRKKAPRKLFIVLSQRGELILATERLKDAQPDREAGQIVVGPYVLLERKRND